MNYINVLWLLCFVFHPVWGQGLLMPVNHLSNSSMDRWEVSHPDKFKTFHTSIKPYVRQDVLRLAEDLYGEDSIYFERDRNAAYLVRDDWWLIQLDENKLPDQWQKGRKGLLGWFYQHAKSLSVLDNGKGNIIELNPILGLSVGRASTSENTFGNVRGLSVNGSLDNKIFFYSEIREIQRILPSYFDAYRRRFNVVPHAGNYKTYQSKLWGSENGLDYNLANSYVSFRLSPHLGVVLGHGKNFIGNGIRSLILSDFGMNYSYAKLRWDFGKLQYNNLYAILNSRTRNDINRDGILPKKYMTAHYLNYKPIPTLELGIYESVIFSRNNGYEIDYLNPIIFYRSVEFNLGSPDNVLMGLNLKWNPMKHLSVYGQLMMDEFKLSEIKNYRRGWWANKWGTQLGVKYLDAFNVDHLSFQWEYNVTRPYTYSHRDSVRSYAHYNQPLAHPWGANFKEWIASVRYQPTEKMVLEAFWISGCRGLDKGNENNGSDILRSYFEGVNLFGNEICQGQRTQVQLLNVIAQYQFYHNYFIDLQYVYRSEKETTGSSNTYHLLQAGLRINLQPYDLKF